MKEKKMLSRRMFSAIAVFACILVLIQPVAVVALDNANTVTTQSSDSADAQNNEVVSAVESEKLQNESVEIEDEEIPLATLEEQQRMSWWWLLIVLVLGTTGAELFRRHQLKKEASNKK